jgi:gamma-glutamyltranspeptidase/glutathione hydrolase
MVATTDRQASRVGVDALRAGGNAVDAAVATALALAVVNPEAGNVGGGGFLVLRTADGTEAAQDHRSTAPGAATRDMYLDAGGTVTEESVIGHRSVATPGSVRGLWDAHQRFGSLPWAELVQPAIELARGFVVTERFLHSYGRDVVSGLRRFPQSARVFLPGDAPPRKGDFFRQPELAATLERIRDRGADGFYAGETADLIVADMRRHGGLITHADLAGYRSAWREPVRARYRGCTVISMPPPSSGGVSLAQICAMLEGFAVGELEWHGAPHVHLLAEVWRRAYADRNHYLTDPEFAAMPLDVLLDPAYARARAQDLSLERATPSAAVAPGVEGYRKESRHTTHASVVDPFGGAASLTTTINSWYGSKVVVAGAGIVLNNDMDDFTSKPGTANQFGLVQGEANAIAPGKRMLSAMAPTIVLDPDGRLFLVLGTPGGSTIITTVFQVLSNLVDHGMGLAPAVLAPRVHHQHLPDLISHEPGGLPEPVLEALRTLGHVLKARDELAGDVEAILVRPDGTLEGVSDPRRGGLAVGL